MGEYLLGCTVDSDRWLKCVLVRVWVSPGFQFSNNISPGRWLVFLVSFRMPPSTEWLKNAECRGVLPNQLGASGSQHISRDTISTDDDSLKFPFATEDFQPT